MDCLQGEAPQMIHGGVPAAGPGSQLKVRSFTEASWVEPPMLSLRACRSMASDHCAPLLHVQAKPVRSPTVCCVPELCHGAIHRDV